MTIKSVDALPATFLRDGNGRPRVTPPGKDKRVGYTRCTTYISCLDDKTNIQKWSERFLARGLASSAEYTDAVQQFGDETDKQANREPNALIETVKREAGIKAKAELGTQLHGYCERINRGLEVNDVPLEYAADLAAYTEAMAPFKKVHVESPCVLDTFEIAGTPDLIVKYEGKTYIADVKTGSIDLGALSIAMQLAVYARSALYDPETETRTPHGADTGKALVIWMPAGQGICELKWVDIETGWRNVVVARSVRDARALKATDLYTPFEPPTLESLIRATTTIDDLRAMWNPSWPPDMVQLAKHHASTLPASA